jgi:hypothetical protein
LTVGQRVAAAELQYYLANRGDKRMNKGLYHEIKRVRREIAAIPEFKELKKQKKGSVSGFFRRIAYATKLIFLEKEIIVFSLLQFAAVGLAYYFWVQMLGWIPDSVWERARRSESTFFADIVLTLWSFACVGLAAYPVGIFSGCIGAAHFLHKNKQQSTVAACLRIVLPKSWSLWFFHWIDGWITVNQILSRLPGTKDRRTPEQRALKELLYYAWKIATMGILPGILMGQGVFLASKNSVSMIRVKLADVLRLRAGYSACCWIIGVGAYLGAHVFYAFFEKFFTKEMGLAREVYGFYLWMAVPILIAVAIVQIVLRPIYLISLFDIYSEYLKETNQPIPTPTVSRAMSALVGFLALCFILLIVFLYREELVRLFQGELDRF